MAWLAWLRDGIADPRRRRIAIAGVLAAGAALRLAYLFASANLAPLKSEMQRVTVSLAGSGAFSDPYFVGSGPTAHVSPVGVLIGAAAYRLFGIESAAAELVLALYAITVTLAGFYLLYRVFRQLRMGAAPALAALALLSLAVIHPKLEVVAFRILEGSLTVALIAAFLTRLQPIDGGRAVRSVDLVAMALLLGLLMLVSPSAAIGGYVATAYVLVRKLPARRWAAAGLVLAAGLALFVGPWVYRNNDTLGRPIATRSNFGLELAISYNDEAASGRPRRETYLGALRAVHPLNSPQAQAQVRQVGELRYLHGLGERAKAWIADHPGEAAAILGRHIATFLWPSAWMNNAYADPGLFNRLQAVLLGLLGVLALIELIRLLARRRWDYLPLLITFSLAAAPYVLVQPLIRYRYLVYGVSVFLSVSLLSRLVGRAIGGRDQPGAGDPAYEYA